MIEPKKKRRQYDILRAYSIGLLELHVRIVCVCVCASTRTACPINRQAIHTQKQLMLFFCNDLYTAEWSIKAKFVSCAWRIYLFQMHYGHKLICRWPKTEKTLYANCICSICMTIRIVYNCIDTFSFLFVCWVEIWFVPEPNKHRVLVLNRNCPQEYCFRSAINKNRGKCIARQRKKIRNSKSTRFYPFLHSKIDIWIELWICVNATCRVVEFSLFFHFLCNC